MMKKRCCISALIMVLFLSVFAGCNDPGSAAPLSSEGKNINISEKTTETRSIKTLETATEYYIEKIESSVYPKGDMFFYSYHILGKEETNENITVYAHTLCRWILLNGEETSGGTGLVSITFKKSDDNYIYESASQIPIETYLETDVPQTVKDAYANAAYFDGMQAKVNNDIAEFLDNG